MSTTNQERKHPPYAFTPTEARQVPLADPTLPPLFDSPTTLSNIASRINWFQSILLISTAVMAIYLASITPLHTKTFYWALFYYMTTGIGITAGYHRYWSHRSFDCNRLTQIILCLAGSGAFEGSIQWWSRGHRAHHRWTDSDKDPYAATRGFFFSHIGWMLIHRPKGRIGYADTADLKKDPLVQNLQQIFLFCPNLLLFRSPTFLSSYYHSGI